MQMMYNFICRHTRITPDHMKPCVWSHQGNFNQSCPLSGILTKAHIHTRAYVVFDGRTKMLDPSLAPVYLARSLLLSSYLARSLLGSGLSSSIPPSI
jgi:hypothetical protein